MKKMLSLAIAVLLLAVAVAIPVSAAPGKTSLGEVPLFKGGITVDGKLDEAYTKLGLKIELKDFDNASYATPSTAQAYYLHDGSAIYLFIDVQSAHDVDISKYPSSFGEADAWKGLGAEVFFDMNNDGKTQDRYETLADGRWWGFSGTGAAGQNYQVGSDKLKTFKATYDVAKKTFTLEYKFALTEGAKAGSTIGANIFVNFNKDVTKPYQDHVKCTTPGVGGDVENWQTLTLSSTEVKLPEEVKEEDKEDDKTENPTTADPITVVAVVAALSGAGLVISKKRR